MTYRIVETTTLFNNDGNFIGGYSRIMESIEDSISAHQFKAILKPILTDTYMLRYYVVDSKGKFHSLADVFREHVGEKAYNDCVNDDSFSINVDEWFFETYMS